MLLRLFLYYVYRVVSLSATFLVLMFFFQAEDGIRDLVRSRGLGDVYKRQVKTWATGVFANRRRWNGETPSESPSTSVTVLPWVCLLYTSDAADERSSVDLGGRRIIKKKKRTYEH